MARVAIIFIPIALLLFAIPVLIGVYVWRDAKGRGMNAPLWTLVSVLAPSLIGFIIYLLVRGSYGELRCAVCGERVSESFAVCPQCGAKLRSACPSCAAPVDAGWRVCPHCAAPLSVCPADVTPPVRPKDSALWKILIAVIVIPVLLLGLLAPFSYGGASGSTDMASMTVSDYLEWKNDPRVEEWLASRGDEYDTVYALKYAREDQTQYLVYLPAASEDTDMSVGVSSGLSGPTMCLELAADSGSHGESLVFLLNYTGSDSARLRVKFSDGRKVNYEITEIDYDPALWILE